MAFGFYFPNPVFKPGGQNALLDPENPINQHTTFSAADLQSAARSDVVYLDRNRDGYIGDSDTDDNSVLQPPGISDDGIRIDGVEYDIAELDRDGDGVSNITYNGVTLNASHRMIFEVFYFSDGTHFVGFQDSAIGVMAAQSGGVFDPSLISNMYLERRDQGDEGGTDASRFSNVTCFAPGTLIDTPTGPRAVETLVIGDLVNTVDRGAQMIRWLCHTDQALDQSGKDDRPVLIRAGALGAGCPTCDMIVSPNHRILVGGASGQLQAMFKSECFAPAKSLTALPAIGRINDRHSITWIHFACDHHEVIRANGCMTESLLLGAMVVSGLSMAERDRLRGIFGQPLARGVALNGLPARDFLTVGQARRLVGDTKRTKRHKPVGNITPPITNHHA